MSHSVQIIAYSNGTKDEPVEHVEHTLGPYDSERTAERAEDGVNRNLDHGRFYTRIVSDDISEPDPVLVAQEHARRMADEA